ncbi:MAG: hypothetical protein KBF72_02005 [Candidatus Syntrophosphaera sp.]|nr:hypothetical protein [Candidatus Syntrophosphaera sp.]
MILKQLSNYILSLYYYLYSSYLMWHYRKSLIDDLIYTTKANVNINVYHGKKPESPYDFIIKYKEPNKRERTPKHIHLIIEMYVKYAYNPSLTMQLKQHILNMFTQIQPIDYFPPKLQFFKPENITPFQDLDNVGEFTVEFLLVTAELIAIQEKTNYPEGSLTESLYNDFGVKDRFSVISKAVLKRIR